MRFAQREGEQHLLQQRVYVVRRHGLRVEGDDRRVVFSLERGAQLLRFRIVRVRAVEDDRKRLAQLLQFAHDALLGLGVDGPRDIRDAAVRRDDKADRAVIGDHLARADFRGFFKGNVVVEPRRVHHARHVVLLRAQHALDQIPYAVHQAHARLLVRYGDLGRLVGHKLGLRGHDRLARTAYRQRVHSAGALVGVVLQGQHHLLHKPRDEGRFASAHGADDADVDFSVRPLRHIAVEIKALRVFPRLQNPSPPFHPEHMTGGGEKSPRAGEKAPVRTRVCIFYDNML